MCSSFANDKIQTEPKTQTANYNTCWEDTSDVYVIMLITNVVEFHSWVKNSHEIDLSSYDQTDRVS